MEGENGKDKNGSRFQDVCRAGSRRAFPFARHDGRRTDKQVEFWERLNRLGARNIETQPPETVPDIDATVELSDREWDDLTAEFRQIMAT